MKKYILILILVTIFSSCSKDRIKGEGPNRTEDRTSQIQSGFTNLRINGSTDAEIIYGSNYKLEVSGYSNLVSALSTQVINQTLVVEFPDYYNVRNNNTKVILTIPYLPNLYINGSANVDLSGVFPQQELVSFTINGSGNIQVSDAGTNFNFIKYSINGSGNIVAYGLTSKTFEGNISGSGEMKTSVLNNLNANISGSGKIYYKGNPTVNAVISGSGKVLNAN